MRIAELARRSGIPVGTVKYYLREGLLPPGELTAATQAQYSDAHVQRLGLIRALLGPGGLSIAATREVLEVIDDPTTSVLQALGAAHHALSPPESDLPPEELDVARDHVRRWGWAIERGSPALTLLADALSALQTARFATPDELLDRYAAAAATLAEEDVASVPTTSPTEAVRYVVVGTLLLEPVLLALRRLAQEDASKKRLAPQRSAMPGAAATGTVVLVIRHGEKPDHSDHGVDTDGKKDDSSLTAVGWERADLLADLFDPTPGLPRPGLARPTAIYAAGEDNAGEGKRPRETVAPLARKLALTVNTDYGKGDEKELVNTVITQPGPTLICWQHGEIPVIAAAFPDVTPTPPKHWPDDRFDVIWTFTKTADGWHFAQLPELLLPQDRDP